MELPYARRPSGAIVFALALFASQDAFTAIGRTPGVGTVAADGEARYSTPLQLPPGTNGMTPALSLEYRHRAPGGVLGIGWSFGGLSQIARCPRTVAQDGMAAPVPKTDTERLCLDGQRLVVVNGAPYGSSGAEYRTEIESFARIRSVAGAGSWPRYFVVETADGRVLEYGATADSRIDGSTAANPMNPARFWALSRIRDRSGNVIDFQYLEDTTNGSFRISDVRYNSNPGAGIASSHRVAFVYETRASNEIDSGYVAGTPIRQVVRLDRIDVMHEGIVLRRYDLSYQPALTAGGHSRLASLQECGRNGADCLAPTSFAWQDGTAGYAAASALSMTIPAKTALPDHQKLNIVDVNGDGRGDLVWAAGSSIASATIRLRLGTGGGLFGPELDTGIACPNGIGVPFDYNADGRIDLLSVSPAARWQIIPGTATGLGPPIATGVALPPQPADYRGLDMNGDGFGDIVWSEHDGYGDNGLVVRVRYALPSGGFAAAPVTLYEQATAAGYQFAQGGDFINRPGERVDFDGDGADDLLMNEDFTMARISSQSYATDYFDSPFNGGTAFDMNGDGCPEFAYVHYTRRLRIRIGGCGELWSGAELLGPAWNGGVQLQAHDWNADGRDDLLLRGATNWHVAVSNGDSMTRIVDTGAPHDGAALVAAADVDGDGLRDIATRRDGLVRLRLRNGPKPDLLLAATDGFGVAARFRYLPLTDPLVYSRGADASFPDQVVQAPAYVVAELARTDGSGTGAIASTRYSYEGLRQNLQGRGNLGFAKRVVTDDQLAVEEALRQDYPFTGLPARSVVRLAAGQPVMETTHTWTALAFASGAAARRYPYASETLVRRRESGGMYAGMEIAQLRRTVAAIDAASGLVTDETTTITELASGDHAGASSSLRTVHAGLLNDQANWCMGRPSDTRVTASHTLAGGNALTRSFGQSWDPLKCRLTQFRREPGSSQWQVTVNLSYDAFGNLKRHSREGSGMAARATTIDWGLRGQLPVGMTNPLQQSFAFAWDPANGLPLSVTDPNALTVSWSYDALGRLLQETQAPGTSTTWTRASCAGGCDARTRYQLVQRERDAAGVPQVTVTVDVDQQDRGFRFATIRPGGGSSVQQVDADARGRASRSYLPFWSGSAAVGWWQSEYDALGRTTRISLHAAGGAEQRVHSLRHDGFRVSHVDPLGRVTTGTRTAWGSPVQVVDPAGGRARYEYDAFGALLRVRDAMDNVAFSALYNPVGMTLTQTEMNSGTWTYTPNALGELASMRDARSQVASFTYDTLGRLTSRIAADGTSTFSWGASAAARNIGRLAGLAGPGYSESFAYDGFGRIARRTIASDATYQYDVAYNGAGLPATLAYPAAASADRFKLAFDYEQGQLTAIRDADTPSRTFWRLGAQDAAGNVIDESLGASIRVINGFDPVTGHADYRRSSAGSATIQDLAYAWDANDNLTQRRDLRQGLVEDFRYDALDRLDDSRRNGAVNLDLDYDLLGNIRWKSDVCPTTAPCYTYDATRRHAVTAAAGQLYAYDANGNMTSRAGAAIAWNSSNLPTSIGGPGGNSSQFWYGPAGNRWKQVASQSGSAETTIYAGALMEKVVRGGITTWRHYVPAPGGIAAVHLRYGNGAPAATRYLIQDHLGSTDRILDEAGKVLVSESFAPFGHRRGAAWNGVPTAAELATIASLTRDGFTGHEHLDNLGLIHMNGRVYDPKIGRFLSADPHVTAPFNGQSLNRYAYAWNNPLSLVDPSGFDPEVPCAQYTPGVCVQITVIGATWQEYMSALFRSGQVASASERDPCGQDSTYLACVLHGGSLVSPSSIVLTVGTHADATIARDPGFDRLQGFAASIGNILISSSPVTWLFGADPDFEWFDVPDSAAGRAGATLGNVGYFFGGAAGIVRSGGSQIIGGSASAFARSIQGTTRYPGVDRFRDITLRKGTIIFRSHPGEGAFYTTASAMRRSGHSAESLFQGLQAKASDTRGYWTRIAAYEVLQDTPAAFGLAIANPKHGSGWLPQVVVPSYQTSLRYMLDFPIGP